MRNYCRKETNVRKKSDRKTRTFEKQEKTGMKKKGTLEKSDKESLTCKEI